ncbi:hypothetical protein KIH27_05375 [Mycobacterium sp. M1]|uniref:Uncharacterized protein n=1 Tax=Mycolicibacter acidiphilus TaxID=2835306 RepID=A0ABS5RHG7_9MYCO|nr:hypothetical protein [Mycolicibacter acidiphilus]MBS9533018.1 hypothetical protein [Mycolicibacter acidiphilus]
MSETQCPVTRAEARAAALKWADDPSSVTEIVYDAFNSDERSGGYAFICDRGLTICGIDGGAQWSVDPGDDESRRAKIDRYWQQSQHNNRLLRLEDVSDYHRVAIAALVAGVKSVGDLPAGARSGVTDTAQLDWLLVQLRRQAPVCTEAAALRALARVDWLLETPDHGDRAHPCPVCGHPAVGIAWHFITVCDECYPNTACRDGRVVTGYNTELMGGFEIAHVDDGSICNHGAIRIEGHPVQMGEAKFGGVFVGADPARDADAERA